MFLSCTPFHVARGPRSLRIHLAFAPAVSAFAVPRYRSWCWYPFHEHVLRPPRWWRCQISTCLLSRLDLSRAVLPVRQYRYESPSSFFFVPDARGRREPRSRNTPDPCSYSAGSDRRWIPLCAGLDCIVDYVKAECRENDRTRSGDGSVIDDRSID